MEDGRDVQTLARPGRKVTADLAHLLAARDATCVVRGCGRTARLEGDHGRAVADGGDSTPDNLRGMCRQHHRRKTDGWLLTDLAGGSCTLEPPPGSADTVAA